MKFALSAVTLLSLFFLQNFTYAKEPNSIDRIEESLEAEITIIKRNESIVEEFRHNGMLFMVKITPEHGYPYYLIDSDGDGDLETRRSELAAPDVVQWRIFSW